MKQKEANYYKIGDTIDNGACSKDIGVILVARKVSMMDKDFHIVLCIYPSRQEYVTWWMDKNGDTTNGHYTQSFKDAIEDYKIRG